jgi:hypothetical protein
VLRPDISLLGARRTCRPNLGTGLSGFRFAADRTAVTDTKDRTAARLSLEINKKSPQQAAGYWW